MDKKEKDTAKLLAMENKKIKLNISIVNGFIMAGLALIFQFLQFKIPNMPIHDKFSFALIPEILASLTFGPIVGVGVVGTKLVVYYFITKCEIIALLDNFIIDGAVAFSIGTAYALQKCIYVKKHKTFTRARTKWLHFVISVIFASLVVGAVIYISRVYLIYPYMEKYVENTQNGILNSYTYYDNQLKTIEQAVLQYDSPTQLIKTFVMGLVSCLLYYYLAPLLKNYSLIHI